MHPPFSKPCSLLTSLAFLMLACGFGSLSGESSVQATLLTAEQACRPTRFLNHAETLLTSAERTSVEVDEELEDNSAANQFACLSAYYVPYLIVPCAVSLSFTLPSLQRSGLIILPQRAPPTQRA